MLSNKKSTLSNCYVNISFMRCPFLRLMFCLCLGIISFPQVVFILESDLHTKAMLHSNLSTWWQYIIASYGKPQMRHIVLFPESILSSSFRWAEGISSPDSIMACWTVSFPRGGRGVHLITVTFSLVEKVNDVMKSLQFPLKTLSEKASHPILVSSQSSTKSDDHSSVNLSLT